jgi:hypothetical protein
LWIFSSSISICGLLLKVCLSNNPRR